MLFIYSHTLKPLIASPRETIHCISSHNIQLKVQKTLSDSVMDPSGIGTCAQKRQIISIPNTHIHYYTQKLGHCNNNNSFQVQWKEWETS